VYVPFSEPEEAEEANRYRKGVLGEDSIQPTHHLWTRLSVRLVMKFSVFVREKITLAVGDRIRFTKNVKHRKERSERERQEGPYAHSTAVAGGSHHPSIDLL
jgi:hypothetical protein